jgi:hypothetical protein
MTLSIADTARVIGISEHQVYRLCDAHELLRLKIGGRSLITVDSIRNYLDRQAARQPRSKKQQR